MSFALELLANIPDLFYAEGLPALLPHVTAITTLTASVWVGPRLLNTASDIVEAVPTVSQNFTNADLAQGPQREHVSEQSLDDLSSDVPALYADGDAGCPLPLLSDDAGVPTARVLVTTPRCIAEPAQPTTLPCTIDQDPYSNSSYQHKAFTNATCAKNKLRLNITIDAQHVCEHVSTITAASEGPSQWLSFPVGRLQPTFLVCVCVIIVSIVIFFKPLSPRFITSIRTRLSSYFKPEVVLTPSNTAEMLALQERYPSGDVSSSRDIDRRQTYQVKMHKYEVNKLKAKEMEADAAALGLDEAGAEPGDRGEDQVGHACAQDAEAASPLAALAAGYQQPTFVVPAQAARREPAAHPQCSVLDNGLQTDDAVDTEVDSPARTVDVRPPQECESDLPVVAPRLADVEAVDFSADARAYDDPLPFPPTASMDTIDLLAEPPRRWTRAEKGKWRADIAPQDVAQLGPPPAVAGMDAMEEADEQAQRLPVRCARVHRSACHARALARIAPILRRRGRQARRLRARRARAARARAAVARVACYPGAEDPDLELPGAPPPSPEASDADVAVAGVVDLAFAGAVDVAVDAAREGSLSSSPTAASMESVDTLGIPPRRYTRAEKGKQRADLTPADDASTDAQVGSSSFAESMEEAEERAVDIRLVDAHQSGDVAQDHDASSPEVLDRHVAGAASGSAHSSSARPLPSSSSCPALLPSMLPMFLSHVAAQRSRVSPASDPSLVTHTSMRSRSGGETSGENLVYFTIEELEEVQAFFARLHDDMDRLQMEMEAKDAMRIGDEDTDGEGRDDDVFDESRDEEDEGFADDEDGAENSYEDERDYLRDSDEEGQDYFGDSDEDEQAHSENSDDDERGYLEDSDEDVEDVDGRSQAEVGARAEAVDGRYADVDVQRDDDADEQREGAGARARDEDTDASAHGEDASVQLEDTGVQRDRAHREGTAEQPESAQQLDKVPIQEQDIDTHHVEEAGVDGQGKDAAVQQADAEDQRADFEDPRADVEDQPADVADQHAYAEDQRPDDGVQRTPPSPHPAHGLAREKDDGQVHGKYYNDERVPDTTAPEAVAGAEVKPEAAADAETDMPAVKVDVEVHAPVDAEDQLPIGPVDVDDQRPVAPVNEEGKRPVEHVDAQNRRPVGHVDTDGHRAVEPDDAENHRAVERTIADLRAPVEVDTAVVVQQTTPSPHLAEDLAQEEDNDEQVPVDDVERVADDAIDDGHGEDDDGEQVSDDDEQVPDVDEEQVPEEGDEQISDHEHEQAPGATEPIAEAEPDARAEVRATVEPAVPEEQLPVEPVAEEPLPVALVAIQNERPVEHIILEEQLAAERADADLPAQVEASAAAVAQRGDELRANAPAEDDEPANDGVPADHARSEGEDTDEEDDAVLPDVEARGAAVDEAEEAGGERDEDAGPALAAPKADAEAERGVENVDVRVQPCLEQGVNTRTKAFKIAYTVGAYEKTGTPATTWIPFPGVALPRTPLPSPRFPKTQAELEASNHAEMDGVGLLTLFVNDARSVIDRRDAPPPSPPMSPVTERGLRNITNLQPYDPPRPAKEDRIATFV